MRRSIVCAGLLIALALAMPGRAEEIPWCTDADEAWQQVDLDGRALIVFVTKPGCPYCVRMKNGTLADPRVVQDVNESFVALRVDQRSDPEFVRELGIKAFPTTLIISPDERLVARIKGYQSVDSLRQRLAAAKRTTTALRAGSQER